MYLALVIARLAFGYHFRLMRHEIQR